MKQQHRAANQFMAANYILDTYMAGNNSKMQIEQQESLESPQMVTAPSATIGPQTYFVDSMSHLLAELERIDVLIQHQLQHIQQIFASSDNYRGLYISEQDIQGLLTKPIGEPWWSATKTTVSSQEVNASTQALQEKIEQRKSESRVYGIRLYLDELTRIFKLSQVEIDILLLAMAPEIDLRYELMYAYLQDDITRKYPSIDLILNLLGQSTQGRLEVRRHFATDANLFKYHLLELVDDPARNHSGLLGKVVKLPQRVVDFLLDVQSVDKQISPFTNLLETVSLADESILHPLTQQSIGKLALHLQHYPVSSLIYLQGPVGSGKQQAAAQIARARHARLLVVDLNQLSRSTNNDFTADFTAKLPLIIREALLQNADLYFSPFDVLLGDDKQDEQQALLSALSIYPGVTFIAGHESWIAKSLLPDKNFFHFELLDLSPQQRAVLWQRMIPVQCAAFSEVELLHIADRFRFTPGQIRDAIETAKHLAATKAPDTVEFGIDELYQACRLNTSRKLAALAKRIVPKYGWEDITLEQDQLLQLRQLHSTVQHRARVYNEWGFGDKLSLGKGVSALFSGPPGTGKTMAAEIIAKSLGLELYKIDLSLVVSKYIGETEKNLSRIFNEAETSNAILFFDEADALFGKRTGITSSHDRYANVEVAYLLQKMEEYDGITILATNLRKNMDEAFVRRLAFIIRFPFPDKAERKNIWQSIWPKNTPLSADLDLEFISSQFKLAGGNIKNIALAASFLAAEDGGEVGMKHLVLSIKREFEKQGRACVKADFGQYGNLLQ